ncbi:MAG: CVNH domain-containing protein [Desulfarculaceae bacterium]|nr:CVNH domain-containing protein [Desulfarculaceae bacterium]MCF8074249.1 CVNH domain-containing protein [Desulfarculaceae bacterium]MCF8102992.1 CVNH domain-containing protein [Desulfarculaceae bacterium]MCF8117123.1 CVNH domain-containing protein [Desulfarculaceae bacterium]
MSRLAVFFSLAILALALAAPLGVAAKVLPPGSYRDSCKDCYVDNGRLHCRCKGGGGNWYETSIKYYRCGGAISNRDGSLVCAGHSRGLPQGSWQNSCRRARMKGNTLLAECKNSHGDWVQSWLDVSHCSRQVGNDNGRLVCGGGRTYPLPGGSWQNSCRRWRLQDGRMWAECKNRGGDWHGTWVDIKNCRTLTNDNGKLRCVR